MRNKHPQCLGAMTWRRSVARGRRPQGDVPDSTLQVQHSKDYEDYNATAVTAKHTSSSGNLMRDLALTTTVNEAFRTPSHQLAWPSEAAQVPDFMTAVREKLFAEPHLIETPAGPALLRRILRGIHAAHIDLSMFTGLKTAGVGELISNASVETSVAELTAILPNMSMMTAEDLRRLAQAARYDGLHLGITRMVHLDTVLKIECEACVKSLTHSVLFAGLYEHNGGFDSVTAAQLLSCFSSV